ncbi:MAG: hypothetical protein EA407_05655 [Rhodobacteraceae bacterium]|nr:MAG: hypothetical protein EA407_05655 [Paracoccaceae bacterium]
MGAGKLESAPRQYEQEITMAKLALVAAFLVSFIPATCAKKTPEPVQHFEPVSAPIYVEPTTTKGKYR